METIISREIREYIVTTWLSGDARGFDDDTDLQQSGILDSFSTLALLAFLDDRFQARLDPADVSSESFRTVRSVARLTSARLSQLDQHPSQDQGARSAMEQTLRRLVAKIAETTATFPLSAHLRDELKVDSVRVFELVFEVEQAFQIQFPEERYAEVQTFADLVAIVRELQAAQGAASFVEAVAV